MKLTTEQTLIVKAIQHLLTALQTDGNTAEYLQQSHTAVPEVPPPSNADTQVQPVTEALAAMYKPTNRPHEIMALIQWAVDNQACVEIQVRAGKEPVYTVEPLEIAPNDCQFRAIEHRSGEATWYDYTDIQWVRIVTEKEETMG